MKEHRDRWRGACVICVGSGASVSQEQSDALCSVERAKVIAVNNAWRLAPRAQVLYAGDYQWWRVYRHEVADSGFAGERWSISREARRDFGVKSAKRGSGSGLPSEHDGVRFGCDSGFQAVQLAIWWGATKVLLVGYDYQRTGGRSHFFGDHKPPLLNNLDYSRRLAIWASFARTNGLPPIVNCSDRSALRCFPQSPLLTELSRFETNVSA